METKGTVNSKSDRQPSGNQASLLAWIPQSIIRIAGIAIITISVLLLVVYLWSIFVTHEPVWFYGKLFGPAGKQGTRLQTRITNGFSFNKDFVAMTDGFVAARITVEPGKKCAIHGRSGAPHPMETVAVQVADLARADIPYASICFPVRAGQTWRVDIETGVPKHSYLAWFPLTYDPRVQPVPPE